MPNPDDNLIISPADSRIHGIATNVSEVDTFWLKGHIYSLKHLLNGDKAGNRHKPYIGGTVYQAYLLPNDYHQ
jgi:phosphatidylserine decarboxylase